MPKRALAFLLAAALGAGVSAAEEPAPVPLDSLLRLPRASSPAAQPSGAEADRERWQRRFGQHRSELAEARAGLARSQQELEELASESDAWQIAAPGAQRNAENSPLSYRLRQEIRRQREEVEQAERALRELEVEASLAGVPAEWRAAGDLQLEVEEPAD